MLNLTAPYARYSPDGSWLALRSPLAAWERGWQWVFPATRLYTDSETGDRRRHHLHESVLQRAFAEAVRIAGAEPRRARRAKPTGSAAVICTGVGTWSARLTALRMCARSRYSPRSRYRIGRPVEDGCRSQGVASVSPEDVRRQRHSAKGRRARRISYSMPDPVDIGLSFQSTTC